MPNPRAAGVAFALIAVLCASSVGVRAVEPKPDRGEDSLAAKLHSIVQSKMLPADLWIETIDGEHPDPPELIVYGSGVGVWARTRQFPVTEKQMLKALKLLDRAGFASMPDHVKGPKPAHVEAGGEPDSALIVRAVTLTIGGTSKTVIQDNKAWKLESFEKLREDLVRIFRNAARQVVEASSLDDGLAKLASGALAPEVLQVLINAPQQRGLRSQAGQGWVLRINHGQIEVEPHSLETGYGRSVMGRLTTEQARQVATWLRTAGFEDMRPNVYDAGYTDLMVNVLGREKNIQAREFAGRDPAAEAAERARFRALRDHLEELALSFLKR